MNTRPTLSALICLAAFMATACNQPRKACRKAERLVARAVYKCPEILSATTRTDTVHVTVPGDAGAGEAQYSQAEMDSVVALCNTLVNRSLRYNTEKRKAHEAEEQALKQDIAHANRELRQLRGYVCRFDTVVVEDSLFSLRVWADGDGIAYLYYVHPRTASATVTTTTPGVSLRDAPCPPVGVANWWRWVALILMGLLLLMNLRKIIGLWMSMKTWGTLTLLLVATTGMAQTDSTAKAHERAWMQPRTDGRLWHDLPPPANVVNAGLFLEHDARTQQTAWWVALIGGAASAVLWSHNPDVGRFTAASSGGAVLLLLHRSANSRRKAGLLLQSGYRIDNRYEIIPDSVDVGPHLRIMPIR